MPTRLTKQERQDRDAKAVAMRLAGADYDTIARRFEYANKSHAWKAVDAVLKANQREAASELRELEMNRLDRLQVGLFARAAQGDEKAIDRVLRIMDHRAKLTGLYEVQPESNDGEIRAALAGFLAAAVAADTTALQALTGRDATIVREEA